MTGYIHIINVAKRKKGVLWTKILVFPFSLCIFRFIFTY